MKSREINYALMWAGVAFLLTIGTFVSILSEAGLVYGCGAGIITAVFGYLLGYYAGRPKP